MHAALVFPECIHQPSLVFCHVSQHMAAVSEAVRTQNSDLSCTVASCDRKRGAYLLASHCLPSICSVTNSYRAAKHTENGVWICWQWGGTCPGLSGSGRGDPGASRTTQH